MRICLFVFSPPLPNLDSAPSCQSRNPEAIKLRAGQSCCADVTSVPNKPIWQSQNNAKNGEKKIKQINSDYTHCLEPPLRGAFSFHLSVEWTTFRGTAIATGASLQNGLQKYLNF